MVRKTAQFEEARRLRKRGFTYTEIAKITQVSLSTVSLWLSRETWSVRIREDNQQRAARDNSKRISLLNKARSNQYKKLYAEAERSAVTEYKHYRNNSLFIAGLMLYLSHGENSTSTLIRLTSAKLAPHRIFSRFIKEFLGVSREKIRFWLLFYPDQDPLPCSKVWAKELELPIVQFHKYQVIKGKSSKKQLQYGVGNTIIGNAVLKKKLMKWMELVQKEL